jgi:RHS repeat-associated protein
MPHDQLNRLTQKSYPDSTTVNYTYDNDSRLTQATDPSGTYIFTYDSFGNLTNSTGSLTNPFRYTARESDAETGLYYYRARYYDSRAGRFLSEDPLAFDGGRNFYRYVYNDPVALTDPTGLSPGDVQNIFKACQKRTDSLGAP